jgi:hypothetical protein
MIYTPDFEKLINFDTRKTGISLDVELRLGQSFVRFPGKIDTGSTNCVFERIHGEKLGLEIENGEPLRISTATGSFLTFGHSLTLITENLEFDSMIFGKRVFRAKYFRQVRFS